MTDFRVERADFELESVKQWGGELVARDNWPVVYTINGSDNVYIGESLGAASRLRQHLDSPKAAELSTFRVVFDDTFNKSVCLDLETYLIRLFNADQKFTVLNKQTSSRESNYYDRSTYRNKFSDIFEALQNEGLFSSTKSLEDIENSNLFKLSPFISPTQSQAIAIEQILSVITTTASNDTDGPIVVHGDPGTGKTVVAVFLAKLLVDSNAQFDTAFDDESFAESIVDIDREALRGLKIGFVVPQQSLRTTLKSVFAATPALADVPVLTPYEVCKADDKFDVLFVDEAHRLQQFSGSLQAQSTPFRKINQELFPDDVTGKEHTQLDWIIAKSKTAVLLLDAKQTIRPMSDLPVETVNELVAQAKAKERFIGLWTQMRTRAGEDYINYVADALGGSQEERIEFTEYDLRFYDDLARMRQDIFDRDEEFGLSRMLAGFAWPWVSKKDKKKPDIEIDGLKLFWNRTDKDWINSPTALEEIGCIHTSQGYDLNYAGVIIGPELSWDEASQKPVFVRANYHDKNSKNNNKALGQTFSDEDLLEYVINVYRVLLTRGIRGTYIYVCDKGLREHLRGLFPPPPHEEIVIK